MEQNNKVQSIYRNNQLPPLDQTPRPIDIKKIHRTVNRTLLNYDVFPPDARILVACSGGPDSMVLLEVLRFLKIHRKSNWHIGVATMDHCIRPEGARELQFVESYCVDHGITFYGIHRDIPTISKREHKSLETVGRDERYAWFSELAETYQYDYIAVAHHKNDQAESVLAHLLRGSGLKGLRGMSVVNDAHAVLVVRPLLNITKDEILTYAELLHIPYCIDASNDDVVYSRNRIRHQIVPALEGINPNVVDALCRMSTHLSADYDYLHGESWRLYKELVDDEDNVLSISRRKLRALHIAMQRYIWQLMIPTLTLTTAHQDQLAAIVQTGEKKTLCFGEVTIDAQYDTIRVYCKD